MTTRFYQAISSLTHAIRDASEQRKAEFEWLKSHSGLVTKSDLAEMEKRIMSAISEFGDSMKVYNDRHDAALAGLTEDVQFLHDKLEELQNNPGPITPEDQAILDALQQRAEAATVKLEALDALTPPKPPVEEPPTEPEA